MERDRAAAATDREVTRIAFCLGEAGEALVALLRERLADERRARIGLWGIVWRALLALVLILAVATVAGAILWTRVSP